MTLVDYIGIGLAVAMLAAFVARRRSLSRLLTGLVVLYAVVAIATRLM